MTQSFSWPRLQGDHQVERNITGHHLEGFLNGWVSGIYTGCPSHYGNDPDRSFYSDSGIDYPDFTPLISDAWRYKINLNLEQSTAGAAADSFIRGWICGAARGGMPLQDIADNTKISVRDIQQVVIQERGMVWRCRVPVEQPSRMPGRNRHNYYAFEFEFDRPCSDLTEDYILSVAKIFLGRLYQRSYEDMTGIKGQLEGQLEGQTILRDIRCAMANGLDVGMLFTIARIKWVKKRCRKCKGRWALGNSTWMVRCISRRCESSSDTYKCNCCEGDKFDTANSEVTEYSGWSGIYQPIVEGGTIRDATSVPPRRLWDVITNRVILFAGKVSSLCQWCYDMATNPSQFEIEYAAITHSWLEGMSQTAILSPINSYLWPIPIPKQSFLPFKLYSRNVQYPILRVVKDQLHQRDIEYCWLDILCLRQPGGIREHQRPPEWEIDVPTIGNIYRNAILIVRYLNGLGKKVNNNVVAWKEPRHWTNRAWTLQEIKPDDQMSTPDGDEELNLMQAVRGTDPPQNFRQLLHPISRLAATAHSPRGCGILPLVRQIVGRSASNPLDQVAGINYLMWPTGSHFDLPIYKTDMSVEASWLKCVDSMRLELKLELLFLHPNPRVDTFLMTRVDIILDYISKLGDRRTPSQILNLPIMSPDIWQEVLRNSIPQWVPTWEQLNDFTTDSFWDQLRLPTLSELRLSYTEHPLQVPTYMSRLKTPFGTFVLENCDVWPLVYPAPPGTHKQWRILTKPVEESSQGDSHLRFTGYAPIDTVLNPAPLMESRYFLLGLSLDIQAPWLVCLAFMDAMYLRTGNDSYQQVSSIAAGITVYPRTLILQKVAVLWTDERLLLARTFPKTMPWPVRKYDAIYII